MNEYETRFNALTASQQQDAEVIDARDGETSLKARLDRDIEKAKEIYMPVEGTYVSTDSSSGYAKDIEMLGNTIQDASNLADIRSVGDKVEGQELYEIPVVSSGKNLFKRLAHTYYGGVTIEKDDGNEVLYKTTSWNTGVKLLIDSRCLKLNTQYTLSWENVASGSELEEIYFSDNNFSSSKLITKDRTFTISSYKNDFIAVFMKNSSITSTNGFRNIQLEEGTQSTPYEPYQEDKLTILSSVQLEKVGDVADRIICKDGVWGVEKNILTFYLKDYAYSNYHDFSCRTILPKSSIAKDIYTTIPFYTNLDYLHTNIDFQWNNRNINSIAIESGYCHITSENYVYQDIIKMIEEDDIWVKYALLEPTFIPLPHDQQVKLRTFAGQTNIHFETEIEPTIKAQVSKSIGATVNTHTEQIGNLSKELDRVKKLEESTVSTVVTESDFTTVEETSNGYFEDVKLEGKTLVNVLRLDGDWFNQETTLKTDSTINVGLSSYPNTRDISLIKPNTVYTVVSFVDYTVVTKGTLYVQLNINNYEIFKINEYMFNKPTLIKTMEFTNITNSDIFIGGANCEYKFKNVKILMLEGDHTQNPPSYFEGLKSVGQSTSEDGVDEIVVSSVNENLFDGKYFEKYTINTDGVVSSEVGIGNVTDFIRVLPNTTYSFTGMVANANTVGFYDINKKFISRDFGSPKTTPSNCYYIRVKYDTSLGGLFSVYIGNKEKPYTPHQSDKKHLLYYNEETQTWEKPALRQWDSIEKHSDGKYYYHKRSGEVVLNGSEGWETSVNGATEGAIYYYAYHNNTVLKNPNIKVVTISDNIPSVLFKDVWYGNINFGISTSTSDTTGFRVCSNSLNSLENFKQWLQANPTTVVYQLAEEKVYECTNIDLITYANETNYVVNSGAITPKSTLKVMCNINNVVRELQQKVSNLENYIQHVMIDALNNALNE